MAAVAPVVWLALVMTVPLSGTVEDAAGRPVAGTTVWLGDTAATRPGPELLATAETDDRGRFQLERANDLVGRGGIRSPTLWAFKPGLRVAFIEFKQDVPAAGERVRLVLGPPTSTSIRVVQPDGKPASGAQVRLVLTNFKAPRPPDKMLARFAVTTDPDGRATLDGISPRDIVALDVKVEGQIVQSLPIDPDTGIVSLRRLGRLKVRVVAADPKALRGWTITARSRPIEASNGGPYTTHWARETTGEDGRVEFPLLAEGQILWDVKAPDGSNYLMVKLPAVTIRPGETQEVEFAPRRGVRVEGAVLEEPGGTPIAGVKVDVAPLQTGSRTVQWLVTDAQGRFSTVVEPGKTRFSFSAFDMPNDYFLPPEERSHALNLDNLQGLRYSVAVTTP